MAVDPSHRYSNETERANWDIYDDFKLKKNKFVSMAYTIIFQRSMVNKPKNKYPAEPGIKIN